MPFRLMGAVPHHVGAAGIAGRVAVELGDRRLDVLPLQPLGGAASAPCSAWGAVVAALRLTSGKLSAFSRRRAASPARVARVSSPKPASSWATPVIALVGYQPPSISTVQSVVDFREAARLPAFQASAAA